MKIRDGALLGLALISCVGLSVGRVSAYTNYTGSGSTGCAQNTCHGTFTGATSPKVPPPVFPSNNKHEMHRNSLQMAANCFLCHVTTGDNPQINHSAGTPNNPGIGCTGCHEPLGLRLHHKNKGVTVCGTTGCHAGDPAPPPEVTVPRYYGTVDTKANNPCNLVATAKTNENWFTSPIIGLDNDGDLLYDGADPDCSAAPTPGETSGDTLAQMKVTSYDKVTGSMTLSYGPPCSTTNNNIEYGLLTGVPTYTYTGQVCAVGNTGTATATLPAGSFFFLIVGNNGTAEGSYGTKYLGGIYTERPEDTTSVTCPIPQNLAQRCD